MKRKIKKIKSSSDIKERLAGIGTFRVTGPSKLTGTRTTVVIEGTRNDAEKVELI